MKYDILCHRKDEGDKVQGKKCVVHVKLEGLVYGTMGGEMLRKRRH